MTIIYHVEVALLQCLVVHVSVKGMRDMNLELCCL